jgi:hypothetical protein
MKKQMNYWVMGTIVVMMIFFTACKSDEDPDPQEMQRVYNMNPVENQAIKGKITFLKLNESSTQITIELEGTTEGNSHPAHIHENSVSEGGGVVIPLTNVDGATGMSVTTVTEFRDGTPVTYEDLLMYDGHVNVHDHQDASIYIAQGDIGSNATGSSGNGGNSGGNGGY